MTYVQALGDADHDVSAEDPKDVVEEEARQKDAANAIGADWHALHTLHREGQSHNIVAVSVSKAVIWRNERKSPRTDKKNRNERGESTLANN